ncbi:aurora kinase A-interacting protein [Carcharodon carcharias]|uniref:aurora kinase A-interacting protein n=1 Tax=Carcharodon carcharias TaxID=13397 RepID=UPI001B7E3E7F|nr:aurora kinase A-interacting protein [Carcharodon carcharias]XP_041062730.1 aurora kinase A-interacting protein [Carcharodon carcharias]
MFLSRLALQLVKAPRLPGIQSVLGSATQQCKALSRNCYTQPHQTKVKPQRWCTLDPELEEFLIPRKLSISPLESWLTFRHCVPRLGQNHEQSIRISVQRPSQHYDCPSTEGALQFEENGEVMNYNIDKIQCKNVLKIRRRKMNRHKYKKWLKRTKFLRRRIKENRRQRRQNKFEKDLKQIWKKAGLKKPPEGWQPPKIFVKRYHGKSE